MLFGNKENIQRKQNLKDLEKKRLVFAEESRQKDLIPERALFVQKDGGFVGIGICKGRLYELTGPAPGADTDFGICELHDYTVQISDSYIKPSGFGGYFGFGEKGGKGKKIIISMPDHQITLEIIPSITLVLDVEAKNNTLFSLKERKNSNFAWNMLPVASWKYDSIINAWSGILNSLTKQL